MDCVCTEGLQIRKTKKKRGGRGASKKKKKKKQENTRQYKKIEIAGIRDECDIWAIMNHLKQQLHGED
jgi:hypothetical protein